MIEPWMIEKLREREVEQARWEHQPRVEVDDAFRRPPPPSDTPGADGRADGGIVTVDFTV